VGVCDDGDKAGGADDGAAGVAGGGDVRGVQLAGCCKYAVGVCDDGGKAGRADDGAGGGAGGGNSMGFKLAGVGPFAPSTYSLTFLFGSVVSRLEVCHQWILLIKGIFVSCIRFSLRAI
jgi:hypothetical protein